jgi:hypothetical protein
MSAALVSVVEGAVPLQEPAGDVTLVPSLAAVEDKMDGSKEAPDVTDTESEEEDGQDGAGASAAGGAAVSACAVVEGGGDLALPLQAPALLSPGYVRKAAAAKRTVKKCEHGRQKSQCKDCKGEAIFRSARFSRPHSPVPFGRQILSPFPPVNACRCRMLASVRAWI